MSTETKILTNADAKIQPEAGGKGIKFRSNASFSYRNYSDDVRDSTSVVLRHFIRLI